MKLFIWQKKVGLKDSKDNWNPADIWSMSISKDKLISETEHIQTLCEYNSYLKEKFHKNEIVGISLKKIDIKKKAKLEIVTTDNLPHVDLSPRRVLLNPFSKNFIFETHGNVTGFNIRTGYKAGTIKSEGDIRIYLEGRMKNSKVQLGAVSAKLFAKIADDLGFNIASYKKTIFSMNEKELKDEFSILIKYIQENCNFVVLDLIDIEEKSPTELQYKSAIMMMYYLKILSSGKEILKDCYYSAQKKNEFSSIHLKVY